MIFMAFFLFAMAVSAVLTGLVRKYALARNVLDRPNHRSLHRVPTPRGGGIAIAAVFLGGVGILKYLGTIEGGLALAICGAGGGVGIIGSIDDHRSVSPRVRLICHFAAAAWILYSLNRLPVFNVLGFTLDLATPIGLIVTAIFLVWMLNLYNFMDGVDGIAGLEAVMVCVCGAYFFVWHSPTSNHWMVPTLLAAASAGFLVWNWPPSRVFMGDVGSGFLGLMMGVLALFAGSLGPELFWSWMILLGVFVVDASVTLGRRLMRGDNVAQAHRSHAYQALSRNLGSHRAVTIIAGAINLVWLMPWAFAVAYGWIQGLVGLAFAYSPLVGLAFYYGAGEKEKREKVT